MDFYFEWLKEKNTINEKKYIELFLNQSVDSVKVFRDGRAGEIGVAIALINSVSIKDYVEIIDQLELPDEVSPDQVPQYSVFSAGAYRVCELLGFESAGLSFSELGYKLIQAPTELAATKYGENHAKLAKAMELVEIKNHPSCVTNSALGKYLIPFAPEDKSELLKRLLLRQSIVKGVISGARNSSFSYQDLVSDLSYSTAIRRRSNVRQIIEFILRNTPEEYRLTNIDWQIDR